MSEALPLVGFSSAYMSRYVLAFVRVMAALSPHGLLWLDDCLPNCAQGKFHSTPVTAYVLSPKQNRFRRLTLKYTYKGKHYTDRRRIHYFRGIGGSPGYWAYDIVG